MEENPIKFLDTKIIRKNNTISAQVLTGLTKLPVHWSSKFPINYKQNAITSELHRAKKIATDFDKELRRIDFYRLVILLGLSRTPFSDSTKEKKNC